MSLMDRLENAAKEPSSSACKLMTVLADDAITEEERSEFIKLLDLPLGSVGRPTNTALARVLREEGYDLSINAVDRHRRGECSCTRNVGGMA